MDSLNTREKPVKRKFVYKIKTTNPKLPTFQGPLEIDLSEVSSLTLRDLKNLIVTEAVYTRGYVIDTVSVPQKNTDVVKALQQAWQRGEVPTVLVTAIGKEERRSRVEKIFATGVRSNTGVGTTACPTEPTDQSQHQEAFEVVAPQWQISGDSHGDQRMNALLGLLYHVCKDPEYTKREGYEGYKKTVAEAAINAIREANNQWNAARKNNLSEPARENSNDGDSEEGEREAKDEGGVSLM